MYLFGAERGREGEMERGKYGEREREMERGKLKIKHTHTLF
jgi:hypothetical protein